MHLVASVCLSVHPSICLFVLSRLKVFVCVSVISGRMRLIARMRSIGILFNSNVGRYIAHLRRRQSCFRSNCIVDKYITDSVWALSIFCTCKRASQGLVKDSPTFKNFSITAIHYLRWSSRVFRSTTFNPQLWHYHTLAPCQWGSSLTLTRTN